VIAIAAGSACPLLFLIAAIALPVLIRRDSWRKQP
jgi:hypothetical protein